MPGSRNSAWRWLVHRQYSRLAAPAVRAGNSFFAKKFLKKFLRVRDDLSRYTARALHVYHNQVSGMKSSHTVCC